MVGSKWELWGILVLALAIYLAFLQQSSGTFSAVCSEQFNTTVTPYRIISDDLNYTLENDPSQLQQSIANCSGEVVPPIITIILLGIFTAITVFMFIPFIQ